MKKVLILAAGLLLLAAGCAQVELQREKPGSPPASYEQLPK